jgi:hypothetical protein
VEANMTMSSYVADELSYEVNQLHKALNQAQNIIVRLQEENESLKDALGSLASENNEDYELNNIIYGCY